MIVGPHTAAAVNDNDDHRRSKGRHAPHFLVPPVLPDAPRRRCQYCRPWLMAAARGHLGRGCTCGVRGGGPHCCTHSSGSDPTPCGQWGEEEQRDVGGITWQTTSGWGRRRRRRGAAIATTMMTTMTMATGKEDVEGQVDMEGGGREEGEEVCLAVLIIVISIIHSVTILSISAPLLV